MQQEDLIAGWGFPAREFLEAYQDTQRFPTIESLAAHFGRHRRTIQLWIAQLEAHGLLQRRSRAVELPADSFPAPSLEARAAQLRRENEILRKSLREVEHRAVATEAVKSLIHDLKDVSFTDLPKWLHFSPAAEAAKAAKATRGVPILCLGDWHFDEVVDPAQVGGSNAYNRQIAVQRLQHTFAKALELFLDYTVRPQYPYAVIAFFGDMLSGNIHEELRETNERPILQSLVALLELLIAGLEKYLEVFGKLFIPCVVGNHGRLDKKPRAKNKVFDNYDWLLYQFLARHFANNKRVSFLIPDGPDAYFQIYNKRILLTHGDQFRGGTGISGFLTPLTLGLHRKRQKAQAIGQPFDLMLCGHFHTTIHIPSMLHVNGSGKGYDEWASARNLPFEPPQQSAFILHRRWGIIHHTPVLCTSHKKKEESR